MIHDGHLTRDVGAGEVVAGVGLGETLLLGVGDHLGKVGLGLGLGSGYGVGCGLGLGSGLG